MAKKEFKQRKQIHLKGFNYSFHECIFFITICTAKKQAYFSNPNICETIINELEYRCAEKEIKLFCYCIMPDHLHILISLEENYKKRKGAFGERTLQNWVSAFKRYTARLIGQMYHVETLWQKNFYDRVVRREESLIDLCSYILNNPVRRGMVSAWEEYPYARMMEGLPL
jgi:putative transposase